jgi:hypothetical protein
MIMIGCASQQITQSKELQSYLGEIESKVKFTPQETLRQATSRLLVPKPLPAVYKASFSALSHLDRSAILSPSSPVSLDEKQARIVYADNEPIFHNKQSISTDPSSIYTENGDLFVTIFLEAQGPNSTMVYFYPHHKACYKMSAELQPVLDANMAYRGRQFVYRLEAQVASQEKWPWIDR